MTFGSLFAGVGGFDAALDRAGFRCLWQVEKEEDCRRVLARHWPGVERCDDVTRFRAYLEPRHAHRFGGRTVRRPDLVCGGFPCQDVSVAGRRAGLAGGRSGLWFVFRRLLGLLRPRWVVIENVPGLLSSNGGRDMGAVLGALGKLGYWWAYRVLDSQYFGLAQRRKRVFIVGRLGNAPGLAGAAPGEDARRLRGLPAQVLFEPESCDRHSPPGRPAGAGVAGSAADGPGFALRSGDGRRNGGPRCDGADNVVTTHALTRRWDGGEDGTGRGTPLTVTPLDMRQASRGERMTNNRPGGSSGGAPGTGIGSEGAPAPSLAETHTPAVAYDVRNNATGDVAHSVQAGGHGAAPGTVPLVGYTIHGTLAREVENSSTTVASDGMTVRRLTPVECARLQGFADDWLDLDPPLSDGAKYRCLGNAVSVPVVEWIARRILATDKGRKP